jgi:hypothetical protein
VLFPVVAPTPLSDANKVVTGDGTERTRVFL